MSELPPAPDDLSPGTYAFAPSAELREFRARHPELGEFPARAEPGLVHRGGAFFARSATVIGAPTVGEGASLWFGVVVRADDAPLAIGRYSNLQDNTVMHADPGVPNVLGEFVSVGHAAILHGVCVEDHCLIGMGAVLLGGSRIGRGSIVAAGAVVREGTEVPPLSVVVGVPGRVVKTLPESSLALRHAHAVGYYRRAMEWALGCWPVTGVLAEGTPPPLELRFPAG